ncbi:MAG: hypothetical protein RBT65_19220 [Methanolobus sp.]|nr:hypothetical protein [Methanolobus sp.]
MSKELKALNEEMLRWEDVLNKCETHSEEMYIKSRIKNIKLRIQIERLSQVINQFAISQPMKPIIMECTDEVIKQSLTELEELKQKQEKKDKFIENIQEILAVNYSYQEIGIKISRLFKRFEEEMK